MKLKTILIGGMSMALVVCLSVGATLAYLHATTQEVTNTFVGSDGIQISLDEAPVIRNNETGGYIATTGARVKSNHYTEIISNVANYKDPTVHLEKVPAGGVKVYAFITGVDTDPATDKYTAAVNINNKWKQVYPTGTGGDGVDGVYVYTDGSTTAAQKVSATGSLEPIFTSVTFTYNQVGNVKPTFENIEIKAFAIQAAADDTTALASAKEAFGVL